MNIWAIADLHLSFGVPNKSMDVFGSEWMHYEDRLQEAWDRLVQTDDLVLIPGDISWALKLADALPDLTWIHNRPGTKVMIRGNHDLWWDSISQVRRALPSSLHAIQNDLFQWHNVYIGGARLWDTEEFSFTSWINFTPNSFARAVSLPTFEEQAQNQKIFQRELLRLEESLKKLPSSTEKEGLRIAMTHYPPIGPDLGSSRAAQILERYRIDKVVFGHLHALHRQRVGSHPFGYRGNTEYILTSCDWLQCTPKLIASL